MTETPKTVWAWVLKTFGHEGMTDRYIITRAQFELLDALGALDISEENTDKCAKEVADAIIILYGIFGKYGYDLQDMIDTKMFVNRQRKWEWVEGSWQHVNR